MYLLQGQPLPPLPPLPPTTIQVPEIRVPDVVVTTAPDILPPWMVLPPPVLVLSFLGMCAAAAFVLYPLMRAIGRRIEGKSHDPALEREVHELRDRVRELEGGAQRLTELEERLDFAERLLAQRREGAQLPKG